MKTMTSLNDHFLIAMPALNNTYFERTVIYLCQHDQHGAMGLVINKTTNLMVDALFEQLDLSTEHIDRKTTSVLSGGPVNEDQGFVLHNSSQLWPSSIQVTDTLHVTTSIDILSAISEGKKPTQYLITLGYSGWGAGQLEQELLQNTWLTVKADLDVLFKTPIKRRWQAAGQLLGIDITLISSLSGHG